MIRNLVTKTVIAGAVATCVAVVGISAAAAQAGEPTSAGTTGPVQTSLITTPAPAPSPAQAPTPAPAPATGGATSSSGLQVEVYKTEQGMSHHQLDYKITNTSNETVTIEGAPDTATLFPGRDFRIQNGDTTFSKNSPAAPITLKPGESAYGEIAWAEGDSTGGTPGDLVASWSAIPGQDLDLGGVANFPEGGTYTATNVHAQPLQ